MATYLIAGTLLEKPELYEERMVLIRFPDAQSATTFYDSAEYQAILPISRQAAKRAMIMLEGL